MPRRKVGGTRVSADQLTFRAAQKYFVDGMTARDIAKEIARDESTIRRKIKEARDLGMVHIVVTPPSSHEELMDLQLEVEYRFNLKSAVIVPGSPDVMDVKSSPEKEAILLLCCRAAAKYLERTVQDGMVLAVPWGRVASYIAQFLSPDRNLPNLDVIPLVGVMGSRIPRNSEANTIAARVAAFFGGKYLLMAAPALVDPSVYDTVCALPLVKEVLEKLQEADVAVTPIGPGNPVDTLIRAGVMTQEKVDAMIRRGAVGEISNWWFNEDGEVVPNPETESVGIGLDGLRDIISRGGRVIAIVAATRDRILPLKAALNSGLINVLISDSVTCQELLKE